ncbi:MAG: LPS export ABC transporter periplasmic protein LptC, partial [Acidobacteriaceae bacterium]|nr:LPS export ABC transporter periplasmic protein LptC [Acidobacteriaceae bacterium]
KSPNGWRYDKDDPQTGKPIVRLRADSAQATHDPSTLEIRGLGLRLYDKAASSYTYVRCDKGFFDERSGLLKSDGEVSIVMNVPADQDAADKQEAGKRVRVTTSGITYETKTGKASTDQPASFVFTKGDGQAVGVDYDPNTKTLHLKSKIALDWIGDGPPENKMHIESADLVYKETEQKIYLSPAATMRRQSTSITAQNPVVTLDDGRLREIVGDHAFGTDDRDERHTSYSGDKMRALFDDNGNLVNIVGESNAKVVSRQPGSETTLTGDRADLRFTVSKKETNGQEQESSDLHLVLADGHAIAESIPQPQPGVQLAETRILRSEHIELEMKPGGQDVQEIRTSSQAQLEFKPNRPDQSHRIIDASHLRVIYGEGSYIDTFLAWNVATHTDKPASVVHVKAVASPAEKTAGPQPPALTWSDELVAKFTPNSNQVSTIDQTGNFRYEEGVRKAWAKKAFLEQTINRITLNDSARVLDDTGLAIAEKIVMNQANGDMDASGHVFSTHAPNKNQKPGTSMLDDTKAMEAQADKMQTRDNNTKVHYDGHAVMWQGANRISARQIDIDRDAQSLHAIGDVISELVDNKFNANTPDADAKASSTKQQGDSTPPPVFTIVSAPELFYRDDTRIADYTGGVKLTREKMTVTAKEVLAYLNPKDSDNKNQSSLNHVFANGDVNIHNLTTDNRTRTGTAEHCEYYTSENKVILNGGSPQMVDSYKGITKGRQLTYYDDDDRLIVEGEKKQLAFTQMKKK